MPFQINDPRLPERFWSKVAPEPNTGCWLWTACRVWDGYGFFGLGGKLKRAHRVAYEALVGAIPERMTLDHYRLNPGPRQAPCSRACCNPDHLEPVTCGENIRRGNTGKVRGEQMRERTHCPQGHPYDEQNTAWYRKPDGRLRRNCRQCHRDAGKRRYWQARQ